MRYIPADHDPAEDPNSARLPEGRVLRKESPLSRRLLNIVEEFLLPRLRNQR